MSNADLTALGMTGADIENWRALLALQKLYNLQAKSKHVFGITVNNTQPIRIPWSKGRIGSVFTPLVACWMGGDPSVLTTAGQSAGLPIAAGATVIFGPEEGNSDTYLIAQVASVDVRCLELLT
jgi:hypothetical protein